MKRRFRRAVAVGDAIFQHGYGAVQFDEFGNEIEPTPRPKKGKEPGTTFRQFDRSKLKGDPLKHYNGVLQRCGALRPVRKEEDYEAWLRWCELDRLDEQTNTRDGEYAIREAYQQARVDDGMPPILFADDDGDREESQLHIEAVGNARFVHRERTPRHLLPLHIAAGRVGVVEKRRQVGQRMRDIREADAIVARTETARERPILRPAYPGDGTSRPDTAPSGRPTGTRVANSLWRRPA